MVTSGKKPKGMAPVIKVIEEGIYGVNRSILPSHATTLGSMASTKMTSVLLVCGGGVSGDDVIRYLVGSDGADLGEVDESKFTFVSASGTGSKAVWPKAN